MKILLGVLIFLQSLPGFGQLKKTVVEKDISYFSDTLDILDLHQHVFQRYFNLAFAVVKQETDLSVCEFHGITDLNAAKFRGRVDLGNSAFYGDNLFTKTVFEKSVLCLGSKFFGQTNFDSAQFFADSYFNSDSFFNKIVFRDATFKKYVEFYLSAFQGIGGFENCIFESAVSFKGISVNGSLNFTNTVFQGDLDFSDIQHIAGKIDLTVAKTHGRRGINLTNSDISKFKLDYAHFFLIFDPAASFEYRSNAYQSLLGTFKNDGYTESYEILDKEYRTFVYEHKGNQWGLLLDKYWWDFGYSKYFIFYWIAGLLLFFTLVNIFLYPFLNKEVYHIHDVTDGYIYRDVKMLPHRFYYSLIYTSILFFSLSVKLDNIKYKYWYGVIYIFIIYLLGLVCIAYLANFVISK